MSKRRSTQISWKRVVLISGAVVAGLFLYVAYEMNNMFDGYQF